MAHRGVFPPSGIGPCLKALRTAAGLLQRELADKAGIFWVTVSKLERGDMEPSWQMVLRLCETLGAEPNDFLPEGAGAGARRKRK
jgi:transcriptional regulator with XRE-family HTH domain